MWIVCTFLVFQAEERLYALDYKALRQAYRNGQPVELPEGLPTKVGEWTLAKQQQEEKEFNEALFGAQTGQAQAQPKAQQKSA